MKMKGETKAYFYRPKVANKPLEARRETRNILSHSTQKEPTLLTPGLQT